MARPPETNANARDDDSTSPVNTALADFWALTPSQRDAFVTKLLKGDPDLVMVSESMLALYRKAKTPRELRPLLRLAARR